MILQPELTFDEPTHIYRVKDTVVPSVSQVLKAGGGGADYSSVPPEVLKRAADIGTAVHKVVEMHYAMNLTMDVDDPSVEAYLPGFYDFVDDNIFEWEWSELLMYHPLYWYAGTVDLVGKVEGELSIIDVKTTNKIHKKAVELQTAAYSELYRFVSGQEPYRRYILWLKRHKTYDLVECNDPFAFSKFHRMLAAA